METEEERNKRKLEGRYGAIVTLGYSHKEDAKEYDMRILAGLGSVHLSLGRITLIFTHDKKLCITKGIRNEKGELWEHWLKWDDNGKLVWSAKSADITNENVFTIDIENPDHELNR
jgi:hypothetical protein